MQKIDRLIEELSTTPSESFSKQSTNDQKKILDALHEVGSGLLAMRGDLQVQNRKTDMLNLNLHSKTHFGFLYSKNKEMQRLFLLAESYKHSLLPLVILGENGCGKEALARMIHMRSERNGSFVVFDAAIAVEELMSHEHGTLYFDEVSLTTPAKQQKLKECLALCAQKKVRIIVSSQHSSEIEPELTPTLKSLVLRILPLRKRPEDILPLMDSFIREFSKNEKNISHFSASALNKLLEYHWPGNISELKIELKRILLDHPKKKFYTLEVLPEKIIGSTLKELFSIIRDNDSLPDAIGTLEKKMVIESLIKHDWNKSKVSRELGISRSGLIQKVQKYRISPVYAPTLSSTKRRSTSRSSDFMSIN